MIVRSYLVYIIEVLTRKYRPTFHTVDSGTIYHPTGDIHQQAEVLSVKVIWILRVYASLIASSFYKP